MIDTNRMVRGSVAIYSEVPRHVAEDISHMLRTGAEEIIALRARHTALKEAARPFIRWRDAYRDDLDDNSHVMFADDRYYVTAAQLDALAALVGEE